jgi:peptidoglycan/xylan/chitin deacetylase (PgdA/CDA1 family)
MSGLRYALIKAAFEGLSLSMLPGLVRRFSKSRGVIFTLHRVLPDLVADFAPNSILQITPKFLDAMIVKIRDLGFEIVSLDEALRRLGLEKPERPFVVLTFDDAYRDNFVHALPILRKRNCPFTLYVPTAFVDGVGEVWWQALEDIIAMRDGLAVKREGETEYLQCRTTREKASLFAQLYKQMRRMDEDGRVALVRDMAARAGLDLSAHCRSLVMDWSELQVFADDPLCTIGAHTVHHYELAKLPAQRARAEISESLRALEIQLGRRPRHFSYPIGSRMAAGPREYGIVRDLGLVSAVTTLPGGLYGHHAKDPFALPRISLNGHFQSTRYASLFLTGALFSLIGRA